MLKSAVKELELTCLEVLKIFKMKIKYLFQRELNIYYMTSSVDTKWNKQRK